MMYYNIITNLEDAIWYLEHDECIETYEQIVETQTIDNAISEAEEEYKATGILLDAKETLASLRRKHIG